MTDDKTTEQMMQIQYMRSILTSDVGAERDTEQNRAESRGV